MHVNLRPGAQVLQETPCRVTPASRVRTLNGMRMGENTEGLETSMTYTKPFYVVGVVSLTIIHPEERQNIEETEVEYGLLQIPLFL